MGWEPRGVRVFTFIRRLFELAGAIQTLVIVGASTVVAGVVAIVSSAPLGWQLVIFFGGFLLLIGVGLFVAKLLRKRESAEDSETATGQVHHHHYYTAPVSWNVASGESALGVSPTAPQREPVGPAEQVSGEREVVSLAEFVEFPPNAPPVIRNRVFRNALLRGPILLTLRNSTFVNVGFGIIEGDPESMFWPVQPAEKKMAVAVLENCILQDCVTEQVGFVGTREQLDEIRQKIEAG